MFVLWRHFTVVAEINIFQAAVSVWIVSKIFVFVLWPTEMLANIFHTSRDLQWIFAAWIIS